MRTLVVGDVHGCAEELAALVARAAPDRVVLVGDLYTKGPDPVGVWRQIRDGGFDAIAGNHDLRLREILDGTRAGDAHGEAVIAALDADDPAWRDHLWAMPITLEIGDLWVVHAGFVPEGPEATSPAKAVSLRRVPDGRGGNAPWHALWPGRRPVVFGHDAARGLVWRTRGADPVVVGLDTGCVYGGALTGWCPEDSALWAVAARAVYQGVGNT